MKWSKEFKPNEACRYNHIRLETPIGTYLIDWKGWKEPPFYEVNYGLTYLGGSYSLEKVKEIAEQHLLNIQEKLNKFVEEMNE